MTEDRIVARHHKIFEDIRRVDEDGNEFWLARELAKVLEYAEFRNFVPVLVKAIESADNSGVNKLDHFVQVHVMIKLGKGAKREVPDVKLSRYACYLIVQNADPSKPVVANGQTYFAIQTRRQEFADEAALAALGEDQKRLQLREEIAHHNKDLSAAADDAGVYSFARFHDAGYKGLYDGLGCKDIHELKGLADNEKILDHMGSTELAANFFRVTQAADKLRRENIKGQDNADLTHFEVGKKVRQTIKELGGEMPEKLPTPEKSIQQLKTAQKKLPKK